jgi:hypothetical protein
VKAVYVVGGIVLILFGLIAAWFGTPSPDDPATPQFDPWPWDFFCVGAGVFTLGLGLALLGFGYKEAKREALRPHYAYAPGYPPMMGPYAVPPPPAYAPRAMPMTAPSAPPIACRVCGQSIPAGAVYCNHCGAPQDAPQAP